MSKDLNAETLIEQLADSISALPLDNPIMIGIHSGGAWIAQRLHQRLGITSPLGSIDISFYRDDFSRVGLNPQVKASELPESVEDRELILVDDVLHTGRTIRAALNEIFSYGRPSRVVLAVMIDRSGRELPIQADVATKNLRLEPHQQVKLARVDETLELTIIQTQSQ